MITELRRDNRIISYTYNDRNQIGIRTITDIASNSTKTYRYRRDKGAITISQDDGSTQTYYLDNKQRLSSYSYNKGTAEEYIFNYDKGGRLNNVRKERFSQLGLFSTNYIKVTYDGNNPTLIVDSSVLAKDYKQNGSNYITRYNISYYTREELKYSNDAISSVTVGYLHGFNYLGDRESIGQLPNKLIKRIIQKTDGEPSSYQDFTYEVDSEGNIIEVQATYSDFYNKVSKGVVKLRYDCDDIT